jgi:hypothetical protein
VYVGRRLDAVKNILARVFVCECSRLRNVLGALCECILRWILMPASLSRSLFTWCKTTAGRLGVARFSNSNLLQELLKKQFICAVNFSIMKYLALVHTVGLRNLAKD